MKTKIAAILFLLAGVFTSCKKEKIETDDQVENQQLDEKEKIITKLHGTWDLILTQGGFTGSSTTYSKGQVIWNFIPTDNILAVSKVNVGFNYTGTSEGTHRYTIEFENDQPLLVLDAENLENKKLAETYQIIEVTEHSLVVSDAYISDGYTLTFHK